MRRTFLFASAAALAAAPLHAETLREALAAAYGANPTLAAQRQAVRAVDENVPIARSAGLPSLNGSAAYTENVLQGKGTTGGFELPARQATGGLNFSFPLLTFGAVGGSVRAADARVQAERAGLRATEADLFTAVVGAYMDVIRDEAILALNEQNLRVLETNVTASRDRQREGTLGETDVAQSEARLALARAQLSTARGKLIGSRENYVRLVGNAPGTLELPPPLPNLPGDIAGAVDLALHENPNLLAAAKARDAAYEDITVARAGALPRLNAVSGLNYYNYLGSLDPGTSPRVGERGTTAQVGVQLQVPFYQGGRPGAQVRQAQARRGQAIEKVTEAERAVVAQTRSAYATLAAAREVIAASEAGIAANRRSLEGVRAEFGAGRRTLLDSLNAEQELLNAEVTLVTAQRDAYVAGFALLAAMGKAEAKDLGLDGGTLYDPVKNYDRVRYKANDLSSDPAYVPTGSTTVPVPVQGGEITRPLAPVPPPLPPEPTPPR